MLSKQALVDGLPFEDKAYFERFLEYTTLKSDDAHGLDIVRRQLLDGLRSYKGESPVGRNFDNAGLIGILSAKRCVESLSESLSDKDIDYVVCDSSAHIGAIGFHLREIARQGYIAIGFQSTHPVMSTMGLAERIIGNNLFGLALPGEQGVSLSCEVSLGTCSVRQALAYTTAEAFEGKVFVAKGQFAKSAEEANREGAILPMGGHKGAALATAIQFLLVMLTQRSVQPRPTNLDEHCNNPFVFIGIRASAEAIKFLSGQLALFREHYPEAYVPGTRYE